MTSTAGRKRQPAGVPAGGEFAPETRPAATGDFLTPLPLPPREKDRADYVDFVAGQFEQDPQATSYAMQLEADDVDVARETAAYAFDNVDPDEPLPMQYEFDQWRDARDAELASMAVDLRSQGMDEAAGSVDSLSLEKARRAYRQAVGVDFDIAQAAQGYTCTACGRSETDCSSDPCDEVLADRDA